MVNYKEDKKKGKIKPKHKTLPEDSKLAKKTRSRHKKVHRYIIQGKIAGGLKFGWFTLGKHNDLEQAMHIANKPWFGMLKYDYVRILEDGEEIWNCYNPRDVKQS